MTIKILRPVGDHTQLRNGDHVQVDVPGGPTIEGRVRSIGQQKTILIGSANFNDPFVEVHHPEECVWSTVTELPDREYTIIELEAANGGTYVAQLYQGEWHQLGRYQLGAVVLNLGTVADSYVRTVWEPTS